MGWQKAAGYNIRARIEATMGRFIAPALINSTICQQTWAHATQGSGWVCQDNEGRSNKQVIGDGLRSRTDQRRATEVNVAVRALNRMLELGRPESVRIV